MKRLDKVPETEIAKPLICWLEVQEWDVYQEVQISAGGNIADVVAVRGPVVWVLEVKSSLTASVVEQVWFWKWNAHYVSVVTPHLQRESKGRRVLHEFMRSKGIGWIQSQQSTYSGARYFDDVLERIAPRLDRTADTKRLRAALSDDHKTFAEAGNPNGKRWTPFQETVKRVKEMISATPGCDLKYLVDNCNHHYESSATFKACIPKYIRSGVVKGIRIERDGRKSRFYPSGGRNSDR